MDIHWVTANFVEELRMENETENRVSHARFYARLPVQVLSGKNPKGEPGNQNIIA
jgi:hypothetical protein